MLQVLPIDQLLASKVQCFLGDLLELFVPFDDFPETLFQVAIDLSACEICFGLVHGIDHGEYLVKGLCPILLDIGHKILDLLVFEFVDDEFVALLEVVVDVLGELRVRQ